MVVDMTANGTTFESKRHDAACSQPITGWTEGLPQE
jgi:hypothetical protein